EPPGLRPASPEPDPAGRPRAGRGRGPGAGGRPHGARRAGPGRDPRRARPGISFIVMDDRLPTAVVAILAGTAFGLSGTIFQTLLRNPLASPDVIGVTLGASAGAVIAMAFFQAQGAALFWCALLGGLATALLILVVAGAHRPGAGGAVDNRFVLVGIGVGAALSSLISYLLTRI